MQHAMAGLESSQKQIAIINQRINALAAEGAPANPRLQRDLDDHQNQVCANLFLYFANIM